MSEKQYGLYDAGNDMDDVKNICERLCHLLQLLCEIADSELSAMVALSSEDKALAWVAARLNVVKALLDTIYFESANIVQEAETASRKIWEAVQKQKETNSQTFAKMN